jgi:hypothetical protein
MNASRPGDRLGPTQQEVDLDSMSKHKERFYEKVLHCATPECIECPPSAPDVHPCGLHVGNG